MAGDTTVAPLAATDPIPWSMVMVVASAVFQFSVEDCPAKIAGEVALNCALGGAGVPTYTFTGMMVTPFEPVAMSV